MSNETKIYHIENSTVPVGGIVERTNVLEKEIQNIIEHNLETYLGIRFIDTEYSCGNGIIDTIGIDSDNVPVIIEYKRSTGTQALIQSLAYLTCIMEHKKAFEFSVLKKFGEKVSQNIDWTQPRVICIANEFKKFVVEGVKHTPNIELIQYRLYENDILTMTNIHNNKPFIESIIKIPDNKPPNTEIWLPNCSTKLRDIFKDIKEFILEFDSTIRINETATYTAFNKNKNFISVRFYPGHGYIKIGSIIDPETINLEKNFTEDGTHEKGSPPGSLMIYIRSRSDFEKTKSLLFQSYKLVDPNTKISEFSSEQDDGITFASWVKSLQKTT